MSPTTSPGVQIRRLRVENYKGIDQLEIVFPEPLMSEDPDVLVLGSRNGLGKTSVLECCVLLLIGLTRRGDDLLPVAGFGLMDLPELMIRAGHNRAVIGGDVAINGVAVTVEMKVLSSGALKITSPPEQLRHLRKQLVLEPKDLLQRFADTLCGFTPDPLLAKHFLYFHSYRKVQEGNLELGMMMKPTEERDNRLSRFRRSGQRSQVSSFKLTLLRALMSRADLFEDIGDEESTEVLAALNRLLKRYAGGRIGKLRPTPDNTVEFRIQPNSGGPSYTFDGLSSGQKEMIATLFLIWYQTRNQPMVVLIDEPELHLNPEWHRDFIRCLSTLAPDNQYLIATHSEDVFASVAEDRRMLLSRPAGPIDD